MRNVLQQDNVTAAEGYSYSKGLNADLMGLIFCIYDARDINVKQVL